MEQISDDIPKLADRILAIQPRLAGQEPEFRKFCRSLEGLTSASPANRRELMAEARMRIASMGCVTPTRDEVALKFTCSVIVDLLSQGWEISVEARRIELRLRSTDCTSPLETKAHLREGHLIERDTQLCEPSVRTFIKSMESQRIGPNGWTSIFSLMRDGTQLASDLAGVNRHKGEPKQTESLSRIIAPYLQLVESGAVCNFTGLKLTDIWRYFRHTWVSTYKSIPGRGMMMLVRDAAAPNHPVIGIAALGSSTAQQTVRDRWIGWDPEVFETTLLAHPTARMARWVGESVERLIESIYSHDLIHDNILKRRELKEPAEDTIQRLLSESARAIQQHRRFSSSSEHKLNGARIDWHLQATTALFRSKRAKTLALMLDIRIKLQSAGLTDFTVASLKRVIATGPGRKAIRQLVRQVKAEHVGVDMMDIIVCGAIAPYNALLGGKLVCLLLTSPQVVAFYRQRYGQHESIIASSMKGHPVKRAPNLVLLATTSLYGVGSSQYNRINVPISELGEDSGGYIRYEHLGVSKGYGSYHFSRASIDYLETLLGRAGGGRKVNSIFGEGVNPLMRKLRDGLTEVGLPTDDLLRHGNPRVVYGIALAENFRDILLGLETKPRYFLSTNNPVAETERLASYWRNRWLTRRISVPGILAKVAEHTLCHPISHGARVPLPLDRAEELFDQHLLIQRSASRRTQ